MDQQETPGLPEDSDIGPVVTHGIVPVSGSGRVSVDHYYDERPSQQQAWEHDQSDLS